MWAGGEMSWDWTNRLEGGEKVEESTRLISSEAKMTKAGEEMVVVGVQKEYKSSRGISMTDQRRVIGSLLLLCGRMLIHSQKLDIQTGDYGPQITSSSA
jgi:DNA/RNA endonuclease YhcR with UshA esterase domain